MNLNRIGTYKGYEVFVVGRYDIKEKECLPDVMYIIEETGAVVLNGEVVAKADLNKMSVDELPRSERRKYFAKKPEKSRGHRAEVKMVDEYVGPEVRHVVETATVDDLFAGMDAIDKYIESALKVNLIPDFEMPVLEV